MSKNSDFFTIGAIPQITLIASALIAFLAITGLSLIPDAGTARSSMHIEPTERIVTENNTFEIEVVVDSSVPVNVFAGELHFSKDLLTVESIDYNTSIADLWAELPWFSNGEGTLNFAGGSTRPGGFLGSDTLLRVTFKALTEGEGVISVHGARILLHDGLGTDSEVQAPIDAIFTIEHAESNLITESPSGATYKVTKEIPSIDLNGDGKQSIADISIFMLNMATYEWRYDFNVDGEVNLKDLNILLGAK